MLSDDFTPPGRWVLCCIRQTSGGVAGSMSIVVDGDGVFSVVDGMFLDLGKGEGLDEGARVALLDAFTKIDASSKRGASVLQLRVPTSVNVSR